MKNVTDILKSMLGYFRKPSEKPEVSIDGDKDVVKTLSFKLMNDCLWNKEEILHILIENKYAIIAMQNKMLADYDTIEDGETIDYSLPISGVSFTKFSPYVMVELAGVCIFVNINSKIKWYDLMIASLKGVGTVKGKITIEVDYTDTPSNPKSERGNRKIIDLRILGLSDQVSYYDTQNVKKTIAECIEELLVPKQTELPSNELWPTVETMRALAFISGYSSGLMYNVGSWGDNHREFFYSCWEHSPERIVSSLNEITQILSKAHDPLFEKIKGDNPEISVMSSLTLDKVLFAIHDYYHPEYSHQDLRVEYANNLKKVIGFFIKEGSENPSEGYATRLVCDALTGFYNIQPCELPYYMDQSAAYLNTEECKREIIGTRELNNIADRLGVSYNIFDEYLHTLKVVSSIE